MAEALPPLQQEIYRALSAPDTFCRREMEGEGRWRVPEPVIRWQARALEIAIKPYLKEPANER